MDPTIPVSIMVFFAGLILTLRFALPRLHLMRDLDERVERLWQTVGSQTESLERTTARFGTLDGRMDTAEANIKTLNGNLVTVRDQVQFKGIAAGLRGQVK